jgi:hypothetical protein
MNTTERGRWEMSKRLVVIGALCIGLMGLWSIDAHAWPASSSGWGATQNTVTVWSGWKGIANAELKPTSVKVSIYPWSTVDVLVLFKNPGGNDGGVGVPFRLSTTITDSQSSPDKAIRNGKWNSYITFDGGDLCAMIPQGELDAITPNPKWTCYDVVIYKFNILLQAYEDINDRCKDSSSPTDPTCYYVRFDNSGNPMDGPRGEEVVHIEGFCELGSAPINVGSAYSCHTDFQWEYSKQQQTCNTDEHATNCDYDLFQ